MPLIDDGSGDFSLPMKELTAPVLQFFYKRIMYRRIHKYMVDG
jgi:hypothetical protein